VKEQYVKYRLIFALYGIDPARGARLCRHLGNLTSKLFKKAEKRLYQDPDSLKIHFKRLFCFDQQECRHLPFVYFVKLRLRADGLISPCFPDVE